LRRYNKMVVHERFAFHVPDDADLSKVGPLMCAGRASHQTPFHLNLSRFNPKIII
jgi:D-arabinose 1-dehydrogenase-like Zn-dependent alcohol dehydrogenase